MKTKIIVRARRSTLTRLHICYKTPEKKHQHNLQKKYKLKDKEKRKVKQEMLLIVKAKTDKINRYQQKMRQFQHNRFFRNNEGQFYRQINGTEKGEEIVIPDA